MWGVKTSRDTRVGECCGGTCGDGWRESEGERSNTGVRALDGGGDARPSIDGSFSEEIISIGEAVPDTLTELLSRVSDLASGLFVIINMTFPILSPFLSVFGSNNGSLTTPLLLALSKSTTL